MAGIFDFLTGPVATVIKDVIDKQVVDKNAAQTAKLEIDKALIQAAISENAGQLEINKLEAQNPNLFVSGWRPGIGWACGFVLVSNYIISPFLTWGTHLFDITIPAYPIIDGANFTPILLAMLGMGGLRTFDKYVGTSTGH